jgi:hypothetical protein
MHSPGNTQSESDRVSELLALKIMETADVAAYDNLTQLACDICNAPAALIFLVDAERTWFKSKVGYAASESIRCDSLCSTVIKTSVPLVVEDACVSAPIQY